MRSQRGLIRVLYFGRLGPLTNSWKTYHNIVSLQRAYIYSALFTVAILSVVKGLNVLAVTNIGKVDFISMFTFMLYAYGGTLLMISIPYVDAFFIFRGYLKLFGDAMGFGVMAIALTIMVVALHFFAIMQGIYQLNLWLKIHA